MRGSLIDRDSDEADEHHEPFDFALLPVRKKLLSYRQTLDRALFETEIRYMLILFSFWIAHRHCYGPLPLVQSSTCANLAGIVHVCT